MVNRHGVAWAAGLVTLGCAGWLCCGPAWGQAPNPQPAPVLVPESEQTVWNVFQPAPSDVRKPLLRARKAVAEGRYTEAAVELGQLLANEAAEDAEAQDYFLLEAEGQPASAPTSLKAETRRLLASLPPAGRDAYEAQFGGQAQALLEEALAAGTGDKLAALIRRFPHTRAGYQASLVAARLELSRGHPVAAALFLQRLADTPPAVAQLEPELSLLRAVCWRCADMPEKARAALAELKARQPQAKLRLGDKEVKLPADGTDLLAWLDQHLGPWRPTAGAAPAEWLVYRGDPQRNAPTRGGLPLISYRWRVPTALDRADERLIEPMAKQYRDEGRPALPAAQPLVVGETILMRTPDKLLGVHLRSGKRIWVWPPWDEEPAERPGNRFSSQFLPLATSTREQEVHQRIWEDAAHGQLSSDGQSVYLLHELGYANVGAFMPHQVFIGPGGVLRAGAGVPKPYNVLAALSVARQGAALWMVGGEHGTDEPKLANAFFLGPPLPLAGKLYALAEFNGEIRLVVLDARNGHLEWQQQLAHADVQTIVVDGARRLTGASPSYADGVLVCPTSAGAVVAVDLPTRSLLWGYQYLKAPADPQQRNFGFAQFYPRPPKPVGARWADATITVADGRVLLTPVESDELHGLDLLTGKPIWQPVKRDDGLYLACVDAGKVVLVGTGQVTALRLADGQPAWPAPLKLSEPPSGRGFYSGHGYYLPTTRGELLQIDLEKGTLVQRTPTGLVLGNLVCYGEEVLSQGPDWLATFPQVEPLRQRVAQALAANPNDVAALASQGELLLQQGKRQEALATLQRAYALAPQEDTVRASLAAAWLTALRDDFAAHREAAERIEPLLDRPQQRSEYFRLMAVGWQAEGQIEKAWSAYLQLARLEAQAAENGVAAPPELHEISRHWRVRLDRWLQARIGELLVSANADQRALVDRQVRAELEPLWQRGGAAGLTQFVACFGAHPAADTARQRLAAGLKETGELLESEHLLARLEQAADRTLQATAVAALADLLLAGRQLERAAACYRRLGEQYGDVVCRDGKTGKQLFEAAQADPALADGWLLSQPWPTGKVAPAEGGDQLDRSPAFRRVFRCRLELQGPTAPRGLALSYDQQRNSLLLRDGWGQILQNITLGAHRFNTADFSLIQARVCGHLLVVALGQEIVAVDLWQATRQRTEAILWRQDMQRNSPEVNSYQVAVPVRELKHPWGGRRRVYADAGQRLAGVLGPVSEHGVYFQRTRELVCADPLTGATLWARDDLPAGGDLFGDQEFVFFVPPGAEQAQVFSALDGRDLGTRPVEPLDNRWATCGRHVLAWHQAQDAAPLELRLYDAWTGRDVWREKFPPTARGDLVADDEVAIVEPGGRCLIRSLRDPQPRVDVKLDPEPTLLSVHVLRSSNQYLVATNRPPAGEAASPEPDSPNFNLIQTQQLGMATPFITGTVYAFDRQTGQAPWTKPLAVDGYGFPLDQPAECPLVVFLRNTRLSGQRTATRPPAALLCVDRRDGQPVLKKEDLPAQTYTCDMVADPREHVVSVSLGARNITFRWEPPPPPAPKQ